MVVVAVAVAIAAVAIQQRDRLNGFLLVALLEELVVHADRAHLVLDDRVLLAVVGLWQLLLPATGSC